MKVFISWSGTRSRAIAEIIRLWMPSVVQAIVPYFTPDDVDKGTRWSSDIAVQLEGSDVGLLILTPENVSASWMLFEAGALSKKLESAKVCPILFGLEPSDLTGPLTQFQLTVFSRADMLRLMTNLNSYLERSLGGEILNNSFDTFWPQLETDVASVMSQEAHKIAEPKRKERELLEEVLKLSRTMAVQLNQKETKSRLPDALLENILTRLVKSYTQLVAKIDDQRDLVYIHDEVVDLRLVLVKFAKSLFGSQSLHHFPELFITLAYRQEQSGKPPFADDDLDDPFADN